MRATAGMTFGEGPGPGPASPYAEPGTRIAATVPLAAGLLALLVLGLWIPGGLNALIMQSIGAIG
jgi:hypothetical protein